jgi:toxin-antitoxin system PIN domain toxin
MIAIDTNVLVHAHRRSSPHHARAAVAMRALVASGEPWALPWPCIAEFVCVVTNPRCFDNPSTAEEATDQVKAWRDVPSCRLLTETGLTEETFFQLIVHRTVVGPRVYDARIAAICLDHGVRELWTADRDYALFPKLRTRNPLTEQTELSR